MPEAKVPRPQTCVRKVTAIGQTKGVKLRNTDIDTVFLHPRVCSRLARHFLVNGSGKVLLSQFVRQWTAEDDATRLGPFAGLNVDKDTQIEASFDP